MTTLAELAFGKDSDEELSSAWKQLSQKLARDEGDARDQALTKKFGELKSRGYSPAALGTKQLAADGGLAPDMDFDYEEPSPLERWQSQIDGMITSGDPALQKKGLDMIASFQQRATTTALPKVSAGAQYANELGLTGKARVDFIRDYAMKSGGTTVNVGDGGKEGSRLTNTDKQEWGLDMDSNYAHTKTGPKPINPSSYTGAQLDSAGYASRMDQAEQTLLMLHERGFDPTSARQKLGDMAGSASGYVLYPTQQLHKQAADTWIRNKLRDESGAAIGEKEMDDEYTTYFPQPGESRSVVYTKQLARRKAIKTMAEASGGKYEKEDFAEVEDLVKMAMEEDKEWRAKRQKLRDSITGGVNSAADNVKKTITSDISFTPGG